MKFFKSISIVSIVFILVCFLKDKPVYQIYNSKAKDDPIKYYFPMAWFIKQNLKADGKIIHFNRTCHSDNYEGIIWYLKKYLPGIVRKAITTIETENVEKAENQEW